MILICTLKEEKVDGKRRAKGKKLFIKHVLAFDRYNVVLAIQRGSTIQGDKYFADISQLFRYLSDQNFDTEKIKSIISKNMNRIFGTNFKPRTFEDIDKKFEIGKRRAGSGGDLTIYHRLKGVLEKQNGK